MPSAVASYHGDSIFALEGRSDFSIEFCNLNTGSALSHVHLQEYFVKEWYDQGVREAKREAKKLAEEEQQKAFGSVSVLSKAALSFLSE